MNVSKQSMIKNELKFYELSIKVLSALLVVYFVINIISNLFYNAVLVLNYPRLVSGILGGFVGIAFFIQIRRFILYNKIGKGKDFLLNRSFILLLIVLLALIYTLFL